MSKSYSQNLSKIPPSIPAIFRTYDQILEKKGIILNETIGKGSYAKVKEGEMIKSGQFRKIAAKIIDRRKAPNDFLTKFLPRELDMYLKIDHPNIIKVYEILQIQNRVYIFMELAEGGDLLDLIKKLGALKTSVVKRLFSELADAIRYCHNLQITHRDLKCENILLDRNYRVKLADFGFSRICLDPETGKRVLSQTYCGSAAYAAPEILKGIPYNPKLYDIWSLGCILYIMAAGSMPFDDSDIKKMIKVQLESRFKYPHWFDPMLRDLIQQMLEPDVTRRANIEKVVQHPWLRD